MKTKVECSRYETLVANELSQLVIAGLHNASPGARAYFLRLLSQPNGTSQWMKSLMFDQFRLVLVNLATRRMEVISVHDPERVIALAREQILQAFQEEIISFSA